MAIPVEAASTTEPSPESPAVPSSSQPGSTLGDLDSHEATLQAGDLTELAVRRLESTAGLPGIIVMRAGDILGVISRAWLLERLSHKFWPELYLNRPIGDVAVMCDVNPLVVNAGDHIAQASLLAMQRQASDIFEPIVIEVGEREYRLIDVHTLMLAQTRLLAQANQQIEKQKARAEAANAFKSQFLANMSHEIRTPLTAIIGFGEELVDPNASSEDRQSAIGMIVRNGRHLLTLVNDILDLSKIEAGQLDVEWLPVSPIEIASDVVAALRGRAAQKDLELRLNFDGSIPETIRTDPTRLRQILINLVGNAIKFTEEGSVTLQVSLAPLSEAATTDDGDLLLLEIIDTGIGVTSKQIERLFQPFTQADESTTRRYGGTGLGLTISRHLAHLLGGDVAVSSRPGSGSTFAVTIGTGDLTETPLIHNPQKWLAKHTEPDAEDDSVDEPLTARVLVVDDAPDNQLLVSRFLKRHGADVAVAGNGQEGVEAALQAEEDRPFDVVLMDMQMPVLDGCEATRRLRETGYSRAIVALTANALQEDLDRSLAAGCDAHASKPIDRDALVALVRSFSDSETTERRSVQFAKTTDSPSPQIEAHSPSAGLIADRKIALKRAGGSEELLQELAGMLFDLCPKWLSELDDAIGEGDFEVAHRVAHTLKNSAENVGASSLAELAFQLEMAARREQATATQTVLTELRAPLQELAEEMKRWSEEPAPQTQERVAGT